MKNLVKAIYDLSKERKVDVGVAADMYGTENDVDTKEAMTFIRKNYNALCDAYATGDEATWDACFVEEQVDEPAEEAVEE